MPFSIKRQTIKLRKLQFPYRNNIFLTHLYRNTRPAYSIGKSLVISKYHIPSCPMVQLRKNWLIFGHLSSVLKVTISFFFEVLFLCCLLTDCALVLMVQCTVQLCSIMHAHFTVCLFDQWYCYIGNNFTKKITSY